MDNIDWNKELQTAISKYDFDKMKEAVKNGAKVDNNDLVLHRVINRDRVDLLEYFTLSPELKEHYNINYEYDLFGENAPFVFGAMCGAIECIKFMLRDPRVSHIFKMEKCAERALIQACEGGRFEVVEFLLSAPETKQYCDITKNNFEGIKRAAKSHRDKFIKHIIMNWDFELVKECMPIIDAGSKSDTFKHRVKHLPEEPSIMYKKEFEVRKLQEELKGSASKINKPKKI